MKPVKNHPALVLLKKAVKLKGWRILNMPGGHFAVYKFKGGVTTPIGAWMTYKDVWNALGANEKVSIREALERDGISWTV